MVCRVFMIWKNDTLAANLEIDMSAKSWNNDRSTIAVESWVVDERDLCGQIKTAEYMCGVIGFACALASIVEGAITEHEADAAEREVFPMIMPEAAVYKRAADPVILAVPRVAR